MRITRKCKPVSAEPRAREISANIGSGRAPRKILMTSSRLICRFAMLPVLACAGHAFCATTPDPATGTPDQFFGLDKVYNFHLTMTAAEYRKLEPPNGPVW